MPIPLGNLLQFIITSLRYILNNVGRRQHPPLRPLTTRYFVLDTWYSYRCFTPFTEVVFTGDFSRTCQNFLINIKPDSQFVLAIFSFSWMRRKNPHHRIYEFKTHELFYFWRSALFLYFISQANCDWDTSNVCMLLVD